VTLEAPGPLETPLASWIPLVLVDPPQDAPDPVEYPDPVSVMVSAALYAFAAFAAVIALAVIAPALFKFSSLAVLSGSMTPTLRVGDVVVEQRISPLQARLGDVVTFRAPDDPAKLYTHRIVGMDASDELIHFVTQGDANSGVERWSIAATGTLGRVVYRVPLVGYVTNRAGSRDGRLLLIVVPVLLLAGFELKRIWRKDDEEPADAL
jgi:signal peptidase I